MTDEMTPSETALEFCKLCGNWPTAKIDGDAIHEHSNHAPGMRFRYANLNQVMAAVKSWCDENNATAELHYSLQKQHYAVVHVWHGMMEKCAGASVSDNPCQALMTACLEAQRKMGEEADGNS